MQAPDRKKMLRRRIHCEQLHLRFLHTLATDPDTIQAEVKRRLDCIAEAKAAIAEHAARILSLQQKRDTAQVCIEQSEAKIRSLHKAQDQLLLEDYIAEYLSIHKKIGAASASSVTTTK